MRERIITANMRLVAALARRYAVRHYSFDDLLSDGYLTLLGAVDTFDYSRGFRFSTYATVAIRRQFCRSIRNSQERLPFLRGVEESLTDSTHDTDDDADGNECCRRSQALLEMMSRVLSPRERLVVTLRYGLDGADGPQSLRVVGDRLGVTRERVRQLEVRAVDTLQRASRQQASASSPVATSDCRVSPKPKSALAGR